MVSHSPKRESVFIVAETDLSAHPYLSRSSHTFQVCTNTEKDAGADGTRAFVHHCEGIAGKLTVPYSIKRARARVAPISLSLGNADAFRNLQKRPNLCLHMYIFFSYSAAYVDATVQPCVLELESAGEREAERGRQFLRRRQRRPPLRCSLLLFLRGNVSRTFLLQRRAERNCTVQRRRRH